MFNCNIRRGVTVFINSLRVAKDAATGNGRQRQAATGWAVTAPSRAYPYGATDNGRQRQAATGCAVTAPSRAYPYAE